MFCVCFTFQMPNPIGFTPTKELQEDPLHKEHEATWYAQWKVWRQTTPSFSQYKSSVDNGRLPQSMNCSLDVSHITGHIVGKQARPHSLHVILTCKWNVIDWESCPYYAEYNPIGFYFDLYLITVKTIWNRTMKSLWLLKAKSHIIVSHFT